MCLFWQILSGMFAKLIQEQTNYWGHKTHQLFISEEELTSASKMFKNGLGLCN